MTGQNAESLNGSTYAKHVVELRLLDHFGGLLCVIKKRWVSLEAAGVGWSLTMVSTELPGGRAAWVSRNCCGQG